MSHLRCPILDVSFRVKLPILFQCLFLSKNHMGKLGIHLFLEVYTKHIQSDEIQLNEKAKLNAKNSL